VEYLECIANPNAPPLSFQDIEKLKNSFGTQESDQEALQSSIIKRMEDAFRPRGNLSSWDPEVLDKIDQCFVKHYVGEDKEAIPCLFFPNSAENINAFMSYCRDVHQVLRMHSQSAPKYAREYFLYFTIWQVRGWRFPVPLGTASVVNVLNKMATKLRRGILEVSCHIRTSPPLIASPLESPLM